VQGFRRAALSVLAFAVTSAGCGGEEVRVHVDSYPADPPPRREAPLCFVPSQDASLSKRTRHEEVVGICGGVLHEAGFSIVPTGTAGCHPVEIAWAFRTGPTVQTGATCFGDTAMFCSTDFKTYYNKALGVRVREPDSGRAVFEAQAKTSTNNPSFTDWTAYAMCKAIFDHYPQRVAGQSFIVELPSD